MFCGYYSVSYIRHDVRCMTYVVAMLHYTVNIALLITVLFFSGVNASGISDVIPVHASLIRIERLMKSTASDTLLQDTIPRLKNSKILSRSLFENPNHLNTIRTAPNYDIVNDELDVLTDPYVVPLDDPDEEIHMTVAPDLAFEEDPTRNADHLFDKDPVSGEDPVDNMIENVVVLADPSPETDPLLESKPSYVSLDYDAIMFTTTPVLPEVDAILALAIH